MKRTLIQQYSTGIIKGLIEHARSIDDLSHGTTKGTFREIFVSTVLRRYLTEQFGIGSGIIVNQRGDQSPQMDIVIYDNRILPPFIREERLGVFPVESVIATIEAKSGITLSDITDADAAATKLRKIATTGSLYSGKRRPQPPGSALIAFRDDGVGILKEAETGRPWLDANLKTMNWLCVVDKFCWIKLGHWRPRIANEFSEETKRFLAVLLDNIRTHGERNYRFLTEPDPDDPGNDHHDWLSIYTRDQPTIADKLSKIP
jgi:hypothetical protein